MNVPKKIRILSSEYRIIWSDKIGKDNYVGLFCSIEKTITLHPKLKKYKHAEWEVMQTLWHEIIHAYTFEAGLNQILGSQAQEMMAETLANFIMTTTGGKLKRSR